MLTGAALGAAAQIPYMTVEGNHEIERDSSGKTFQSWTARYPNPYKQSNSTSNLYYSFDYAGEPSLHNNSNRCCNT